MPSEDERIICDDRVLLNGQQDYKRINLYVGKLQISDC